MRQGLFLLLGLLAFGFGSALNIGSGCGVDCRVSVGISAALAAGSDKTELTIVSGETSHKFEVEVAITVAERSKGLMFRRNMADDAGMLFDFGDEQDVTMWMRNTYIPLDMIFAKKDGTIHHIVAQTEPHSERTISSGGEVRYVLEVNAGLTSQLDISVGDRLQHELIVGN